MMSENIYVGISLGFNSSACVVSNLRGLLFAISQERLTGKKNTKEIPLDALHECAVYMRNNKIDKIVNVAVSHYQEFTDNEILGKYKSEKYGFFCERFAYRDGVISSNNPYNLFKDFLYMEEGIDVESNSVRIEHHTAHQFANLGFYDIDRIQNGFHYSSDGFGDGVSARISFFDNYANQFQPLGFKDLISSTALIYQFTTGALGFKEHQHEGKITGLAAYGEPHFVENFKDLKSDAILFGLTREQLDECEKSTIKDFDCFLKLKEVTYNLIDRLVDAGASREDIAASVQEFAEEEAIQFLGEVINDTKMDIIGCDLFLSGGLFANVKINQRLRERFAFKEVMVCPPMGDEGTCVGAAFAEMFTRMDCEIDYKIETLGRNKACVGTIPSDDFDSPLPESQIELIANELACRKIVCFVHGRMEFGPRALCRRSILYDCSDYETNKWLNEKLNRTEFMPFAPVCIDKNAPDLFVGIEDSMETSKYMTMTFDCTEEMKRDYKAACHVDGTARPQVVNRFDDYDMYRILEKYEEMTGKKALINTSFNLHNNPIIESTEEAFGSWIVSGTDILVVGGKVIKKHGGR